MVNYVAFFVSIVIAVFLAFNMGASGTAPSFSAPYGANLIRRELIPGLFGTFVFLGAVVAGGKVLKTIGGEILPSESMSLVLVSILLLASALSIFFANLLKVPQSTSQSTIFALSGCAFYLNNLKTQKLFLEIIPIWFVTPLISFLLTYLAGAFLLRMQREKGIVDFQAIRRKAIWKYITIACSCYVAFSIGSNNVANSAGPIASMLLNELHLDLVGGEMIAALLSIFLVAPWFGIGSSFLGKNILETTSIGIIKIGPLAATFIAFITATLLLLASTMRGIPTSLVQMNVFAIIAVGMLKEGRKDILTRATVKKLFITWLVAPIIAFILAYVLLHTAVIAGLM